ncbi:MAG: hypothetical protein J6V06_05270 [Clostridia bacterium]|nr:hypothetical protein [Clostridia bacterium]MBO7319413.1 hypothetical protein [Clostridia bacterium]
MAIPTINKLNVTDEDISNPVICPSCGKTVGMRLFGAEDKSTVGKLFPEKQKMAVAVCPMCAAVYKVADNYYKERKNGTLVYMTEKDLESLERK